MRKLSIAGAIIGLMLLAAPSALAWQYHLPFNKARNVANAGTRAACTEDAQCVKWGAHCDRVSQQRINCLEGTWDEPELYEPEPGEYILCEWVQKFGVGPGGYITSSFGEPNCHVVYE